MENGTLQTWGKEVFDLLSWYKNETVRQARVMVSVPVHLATKH